MQFDAFISYSSADKLTADAACATLEAAGVRCWIAPRDIMPGREYGDALVDALDHCRVLVLVFSSRANTSPQIRREVERVVSRGVPVIPLRIEDVLPTRSMAYFVGSVHWLDALTPPLEQHLQRLAGAVKALLQVDPEGADHIPNNPDVRGAPPLAGDLSLVPNGPLRATIAEVPERPIAALAEPIAGSGIAGPRHAGVTPANAALADEGAHKTASTGAETGKLTPEEPAPPNPAISAHEWPAGLLVLFGIARCAATVAFWAVLASRSQSLSSTDLLLLTELFASGAAAFVVGRSLRLLHRATAIQKIICGLGALSEAGWFIFSATLILGGGIAGAAILCVILPSPFGVAAFVWGFVNLRRKQAAAT